MSNTKFTAGPWRVGCPSNAFTVLRDTKNGGPYTGGGITIRPVVPRAHGGVGTVCCLTWDEMDKEEPIANANLIAAAPELYEALIPIAHYGFRLKRSDTPFFEPRDDETFGITITGAEWKRIIAALAKARGEAP